MRWPKLRELKEAVIAVSSTLSGNRFTTRFPAEPCVVPEKYRGKAEFDLDKCVGCGACTQDVCFVDAIRLVDGHAVIDDACRGCGRCVDVCPEEAIEMSIEYGDFVERSIDRIAPLVDVS